MSRLGFAVQSPALDHPGYVAGRWYNPIRASVVGGASLAASTARFLPFFLPKPVTISDLGVRVTTAVAASNVRAAIYAAHSSAHLPTGLPLAQTGDLSAAVADVVSAAITGGNVALAPGWYWMAVVADTTGIGLQTAAVAQAWTANAIGSATLANISAGAADTRLVLSVAMAFGSFADMTGAAFTEATTGQNGLVFFKAA